MEGVKGREEERRLLLAVLDVTAEDISVLWIGEVEETFILRVTEARGNRSK